ncbi:MAG: tRNA (N6-isopentenyl adenosine(37)-C2)-methylthiotransferase MiaB [Clostridia bacterium]|nr:tRNA (N6-isopentenyl adenosine(37)-C2)-methylthiotransferase MiaB [Clostridia bacterium]
MTKYYFIKTYGCQMNVHESEKLAGMLESLGYAEANEMEKADVIVFNTCSIRDGCEQKVFGNVGSLKHLKKSKPNLVIAMCGCLTQIKGRPEMITKKFPYVNIIFGTHNLHEFKHYLETFERTHKNIVDVWDKEGEICEDTEITRTSGYNAWVNINFGCNNFCTYCIVPYVRGRERSREMKDIVKEVECLVKQGYKTITLLGQNVNSYGNDVDNPNVTFANLLKEICKLDGDFKIKFMTSHPKDLSSEVIDTIANEPKLAKVIHLPVQSGNNKILKKMNRNYTREHYLDLIHEIRSKIPNAILSTDIIVGFPSETEEEFMDTYTLMQEVRYDGVFAFMFSPRTGTPAERMENQIDSKVKNERVNRLLKLTKQITKEKTKEMLNNVYEIILTAKCDGGYTAETLSGKNVVIHTDKEYPLLSFHNAKIINVNTKVLEAQII